MNFFRRTRRRPDAQAHMTAALSRAQVVTPNLGAASSKVGDEPTYGRRVPDSELLADARAEAREMSDLATKMSERVGTLRDAIGHLADNLATSAARFPRDSEEHSLLSDLAHDLRTLLSRDTDRALRRALNQQPPTITPSPLAPLRTVPNPAALNPEGLCGSALFAGAKRCARESGHSGEHTAYRNGQPFTWPRETTEIAALSPEATT